MPTFARAREAKDEPLTLPMPGRDGLFDDYEIRPATARQLIDLATIEKVIRKTVVGLGDTIPQTELDQLDALTEQGYVEMLLGADVFARMVDRGVGSKMLTAAALTAQTWHLQGIEQAHEVWTRLTNPEDPTTPTPAGTPAKGGRSTQDRSSTGSRSGSKAPRTKHPKRKR